MLLFEFFETKESSLIDNLLKDKPVKFRFLIANKDDKTLILSTIRYFYVYYHLYFFL